ncbi:MAG: response regulator transcription factor [Acidobacteria bacterium]|nr:MAG: response regulator transcription factor [Acidobacteriota bacterium]
MKKSARVLVVEDEKSIREGLRDVLTFHGYDVQVVETGEAGLESILGGHFQLVLLDVMLPGLNGFDVCRKVRESGASVAILMLTAKGSEDDIVEGLSCGADDYVTKPFSIRELTARVEALVRRTSGRSEKSFRFGEWTVDPATLQATLGGETCELTPRELDLVALFVSEKGRVVSRRVLLKEVWEMAKVDEVETRTVDMHIAKLRKKLDPDGRLILTVRGAGYRYRG